MSTNIGAIGWVAGVVTMSAWLAGCTTPGITRVSSDTFRVSRADPGQVFANDEAMKAAAVADANAFASGRGMVAVPVSVEMNVLPVGHLRTLDYEFQLVAPGVASSPAVSRAGAPVVPAAAASAVPAAVPAPGPAVTPGVAAPPPPGAPVTAHRSDYYDELIRLDELRKRGILTDAEFQTLKAKVIADR